MKYMCTIRKKNECVHEGNALILILVQSMTLTFCEPCPNGQVDEISTYQIWNLGCPSAMNVKIKNVKKKKMIWLFSGQV